MRPLSIIVFYSVVIFVYLLVNYYIFIRGWQALPSGSKGRSVYLFAFLFISLAFIAGRIVENFWLGQPASFLIWTGSFWLGAMLYILLILVMIDLVRVLNLAVPVIPATWLSNSLHTKKVLFFSTLAIVVLIVAAAHVNTWYPRINRLEVNLDKRNSQMDSVSMVLISDIHLGTLTPKHRIRKMVEKVNSLEADMILLAGDILDEDVGPVIKMDLGSSIKDLSAPLGVYGVTGNHEYIGGVDTAAEYITSHGIYLIRDTVININNSFYLAGREDLVINRFTDMTRKNLEDLLAGIEDDLPVIMLDHQPFDLKKSAAAGVHFQMSGHTHHGQLWPLNFITRMVYKVSRGLEEIDGMKVYVSNGIGTWGPPMRLGNRPEIVFINVSFSEN